MDLTKLIRTRRDADASANRLHILFAASEVAPFSKTGGLADVASSLPRALAHQGHHVSIITPRYAHIDPQAMRFGRRIAPLEVPRQGLNRSKLDAVVWEGRLGQSVRAFFVDAPEYFDRDGIYGSYDEGFADNAERFAFFSRAVVEFARTARVPFDAIHCNDWHTALAPVYARHYYAEEFAECPFVLTLHNVAYQGAFGDEAFAATGLPKSKFYKSAELRHGDGINLLKGGLIHSDLLTTVSPTYAQEIQGEQESRGLGEVLRARAEDLEGVLNGADYAVWSPDVDTYIPVRYTTETLNGKRQDKAELQHRCGLPVRPTLPLLGFVGRLTEQKGLDLLIPSLRQLLSSFESERDGFQVVCLGEGQTVWKEALAALAEEFPTRVAVFLEYHEEAAHLIQAGADILLVPSRFEPCGLTQLYAMRYGTLPLVHATGGLADTVLDTDEHEHGTGFVFHEWSTDALVATIERATARYRQYRQWRPMMVHAMTRDHSWEDSARRYAELYQRARARRRSADDAAE